MAVQFKSGAHASLHFHGETGCFFQTVLCKKVYKIRAKVHGKGVNFSLAD